jgi:hypothetical protein
MALCHHHPQTQKRATRNLQHPQRTDHGWDFHPRRFLFSSTPTDLRTLREENEKKAQPFQ